MQRGLHRLAKPWHRRRALWIFRDQTGLAVTPHLWTSIQKALDNSDYFVLLASPEAARSPWVNREIEHWVATKSTDRILPVVTDGEWRWDPVAKDFDQASTAVPPALRGVFAEEPLYLDLRWARGDQHLSLRHSRFRDAIAQLAAPMHGVSKDDLEGEDVRQHRRAGRLRLAAVASLAVLTVLASMTGMAAVRNAAQANASAVEARMQQQEASTQRGSAARFADEAQRQKDSARAQEARARQAASEAARQEESARRQKSLASTASAEVRRQLEKADQAAARARRQQQLARRQSALARESAREMHRQEQRAKEQEQIAREQERLAAAAGADARAQKAIAEDQKRLAAEAGALARKQEAIAREQEAKAKEAGEQAARQQRIAIGRRLVNEAKATVDDDPQAALKLGIAAQKVYPDAETRRDVANVVTSTRHAGTVNDVKAVAYGPDNLLLSVNRDFTVSLWNVADRAHPVRLSTFGDATPVYEDFDFSLHNAVDLSRDGRTLAVVGHNTTVLWDVTDRARPARIATLPSDRDYYSVAFSPDGLTLVTGDVYDRNGYGTLWDVTDRSRPSELSRLVRGRWAAAYDFVFSPDSRTLVAGNQATVIWDITDRKNPVKRSEIAGPGAIYAMAFSPTEPVLAIGNMESLTLYDLSDTAAPARRTMLVRNDETYYALAYSSDGRILASAGFDGKASLWEVDGLRSRALGKVPGRASVNSLALSPDGQTLVTADNAGTAVLWNVAEFAAPRHRSTAVTGHDFDVKDLRYSPDGRSMTTVGDDGTATFWDVTDPVRPKLRATAVVYPQGWVDVAAISPDGRTIVAGSYSGGLMMVDVTDPSAPEPFASLGLDALNAVVFSPDGKTLVIGDGNKRHLWDMTDRTSPKPVASLTLATSTPGTTVFSPDGRTLAVATNRSVSLWDVTDRQAPAQLSTLVGHGGYVGTVRFSPDGRTVATGSSDRTAMLWDVTDRAKPHRLATLAGHGDQVGALVFGKDGKTLATGDNGSWVTVWDVSQLSRPVRQARAQLQLGHAPSQIDFSRDGAWLIVATAAAPDAFIEFWNVAELNDLRADPARFGCTLVDGGLTAEEWARLIPELPYQSTCAR